MEVQEVWKTIPRTKGGYSISNLGRVRSNLSMEVLKTNKNSQVSFQIEVREGLWKRKSFTTNSLAKEAFGFIPRPPKTTAKAVVSTDEEGVEVLFESITEAHKKGFNLGGIANSLKTGVMYRGKTWRYA